MSASLVVSLDLELAWGVHDSRDLRAYRANLEGVREAVDGMLSLFERYEMRATWATVGLLMCESAEDARRLAPEERPRYRHRELDPYRWLDAPRPVPDSLFFGPDLVRAVASADGQELATHTFGHFLCLEEGGSPSAFEADLAAAKAVASRHQIELRSIVFPRNQHTAAHIERCGGQGIDVYRGNPAAMAYAAAPGAGQTLGRRGLRLLDAHAPVLGPFDFRVFAEPVTDVPASRFLRPAKARDPLRGLRHRRILRELAAAASRGSCYHLWWHPHNLGADPGVSLAALEELLVEVSRLRDRSGFESFTMAEAADAARAA